MVRWGMVIDLKRCIGCLSCVIACKSENGTPPGVFWRKVLLQEIGKYPNVRRLSLPTGCMHCNDPPCMKACPSGAISKRKDGIVIIDEEKCYGAKACILACPYEAISFVEEYKQYWPSGTTPYEKLKNSGKIKGVSTKCTFCAHKNLEGGELPACVMTCPTKALTFGDLEDPNSEVAKLIRGRGGYQLKKELGTDPAVYYLPW